MASEIGAVLDVLVGERLWAFGRAHTLWWLHFGERREVPEMRRGEVVGTKEVGAYALHLQCPWVVADRGGVLVGRGDLFLAPGDDPYAEYGLFDWAPQGANRADVLLAGLLSRWGPGGILVESAEVGWAGAFRLGLEGGLALCVLPEDSVGEQWRFFRPAVEEPHFVVFARGFGEGGL